MVEIREHIPQCLAAHIKLRREDVPLCCSLIHTSTAASQELRDQRAACIDTLNRYIANIVRLVFFLSFAVCHSRSFGAVLSNPEEPKFRRIKISNKALQSRVVPVAGGVEFLKCLGFEDAEYEGEPVLLLPGVCGCVLLSLLLGGGGW